MRYCEVAKMTHKRFFPIFTAAVMALSLCVSSCSSDGGGEEIVVPIYETDDISYNTVEAVIDDITEKYYSTANFTYPYYEKVYFSMSGTIDTVEIESGQTVEEGDLLCVLNSDDLDTSIEEKKVYLEQAEETLATLKANGGSATEISLAQKELEIEQLEYDHLVDSLEDYKVYAPCSGIFYLDSDSSLGSDISEQRNAVNLIVEGAQVYSGQSLGLIQDHSQKYLVCEIYDNPLENVNFGTKATLTQIDVETQGKVIDIIYNSGESFVSYSYVIATDDDSGLVDLEVSCCFDVYSVLDAVLVPTEAIKSMSGRNYVNVLIDDSKVEQDVETGIEDGDLTEITSGLVGGEQIIIN